MTRQGPASDIGAEDEKVEESAPEAPVTNGNGLNSLDFPSSDEPKKVSAK